MTKGFKNTKEDEMLWYAGMTMTRRYEECPEV